MEQRDLTSTFRDQLSESEGSKLPSLMDIPDEKNANHAGGHSFQRVLLRFVFKGKGRSLNQAENSAELLQAAVQWIDGLIDLDEKGIIHRDISYGNLLLPSESGGAKIIDLGLSHLKNAAKSIKEFASDDDENYDEAISGCPHAHHHITGTLPFVAHDLLYALWRAQSCEHTLYHDVESIFWVLLYVCLKEHGGPMAGIWTDVLSSLTSSEIGAVVTQKNMCLTKEGFYNNIGGKFGDLEGFFSGYYDIYRWHGKEVAKDTATRVRNLALSELQKILASQVTNEQKIHPS
ncbi:hypothetical protein M407DRAFT_188937 [Tulasnella calospora MUT 4182]|uniref:Protein kinase domain-containing protein n=1 Tax=Tulasnella calospora MUT 4182 TaxID=1051891 RepID=A0A0C3Q268_9AGAM|nr:hypothetical protein M407DRAFT_188937 [Tulasnella calospora MUT 4182]